MRILRHPATKRQFKDFRVRNPVSSKESNPEDGSPDFGPLSDRIPNIRGGNLPNRLQYACAWDALPPDRNRLQRIACPGRMRRVVVYQLWLGQLTRRPKPPRGVSHPRPLL